MQNVRNIARGVGIALVTLAVTAGLTPQADAADPRTLVVSRHTDNTRGDDRSATGEISGDGRYVAFESSSTNLVDGDTNNREDIFVHDLATGETELVSVHSAGIQGDDHSAAPAISDDGRYVAFHSFASNLVSGDTNGVQDVFVHDRMTRRTFLVSRHSVGTYGNNHSFRPSISGGGRFVAFDSLADNLVSGDTNGVQDVFVHDRLADTTGRTTVVSRHSLGTRGNDNSSAPALSADGRYVAFESLADNLVSGDSNGFEDVFVHDRLASTTGRTTVVSRHSLGTRGNDSSSTPDISGDGRYVAFESNALLERRRQRRARHLRARPVGIDHGADVAGEPPQPRQPRQRSQQPRVDLRRRALRRLHLRQHQPGER